MNLERATARMRQLTSSEEKGLENRPNRDPFFGASRPDRNRATA